MHANSTSTERPSLTETLERFEKVTAEFAHHLTKLRERVHRAKASLATHPGSKELAKFLDQLKEFQDEPAKPDLAVFVDDLQKQLTAFRRGLRSTFGDSLRSACVAQQIPFRVVDNGYGIGALLLSVDLEREIASLSYAKTTIRNKLPLDAPTCVIEAKTLTGDIIDEATEVQQVRARLEEAVRVLCARKKKSTKGDLRGELPQVYREMAFIRELDGKSKTKTSLPYTLPRFVVELSRFIQSEENINSRNPLRLETAVIENSKNPSKSVFIPKDLACGFGEGTYYQAVVFRGE